jgi:uncharacterized membrane protein
MTTPAPTKSDQRRASIDWMRGFVMVLMALDHASQTWNGGRVAADSAYLLSPITGGPAWIPGTELDPIQFYTRWITHLCAPAFLFLSGTSLAMSFEKRRAEGMKESELDRHLLIRAGVILGFEGLLSLAAAQGVMILQVLFAISFSMVAMVALRRLPTSLLVAIGAGWLLGSEWVLNQIAPIGPGPRAVWEVIFFVPGYASPFYSMYPMTHWAAMMLLGWGFGRYLLNLPNTDYGNQQAEKMLLFTGLTALLAWGLFRSANSYGNMGLYRDDTTIVQWLHMSKYPTALVYSCMELGLMALCLLGFMRFERRLQGPPRPGNPLLVFGQTALFFYVLHFILLGGAAIALTGGLMQRGLRETYLATAAVLIVLYPVCIGFRNLKRKYPKSFLQYI